MDFKIQQLFSRYETHTHTYIPRPVLKTKTSSQDSDPFSFSRVVHSSSLLHSLQPSNFQFSIWTKFGISLKCRWKISVASDLSLSCLFCQIQPLQKIFHCFINLLENFQVPNRLRCRYPNPNEYLFFR